ncbi:hypothetical protein Tco_0371673 [Tanacetum coccineum]
MEKSQFNKFKEDKLRILLVLETKELLQPQKGNYAASQPRAGQILDEEQLAFLADPRIDEAPVASQTIPQNSAFQTEDLDAYDSNCDDISLAKAVPMANISRCDLDVLSEVPYSDTYLNDMINQDVQEMPYSEQTYIMDSSDNEITSDSNIILYSQYLQESQNTGIQDTNSSAPNDLLVLSLVEQMTDHVANLDKENQTNKMVNEFLTDELERYKERVTIFERRLNVDLNKQQAFWLKYSNYNPNTSVKSHTPVRIEAPSELPKTRVQSKEHCDSLIAQINAKSVENSDLNAQLQEKVFAIAALKNELRKLKGKNVVDTAVSKPIATIAPGMFKLDIEPISHRLKNNRDAHEVYLEKTIENTNTLRGLVECARKQNPSEPLLESACMFTKHVQELLVYVSKTCPSLTKPCEKLVVVTPMNRDKKVRFVEHVTSSSNIPKQTDSLRTKDSNKPLLTYTGVNTTTSASGSKPLGNTKKNRISRPPSSNLKNKVEEHPGKVDVSLCGVYFIDSSFKFIFC